MHNKIYIIGPVGSGKTTFSKNLSKKSNIKRYELDKVSWNDEDGGIKRSDEEVLKMFDEILNNESWIIEDIGRSIYTKGREEADIIYYIKMSKFKSYLRVTKRWLRQKFGKEEYTHKPDIKQLISYMSVAKSYYQKEKRKLHELENYQDKLVFVNKKKMKSILKENN